MLIYYLMTTDSWTEKHSLALQTSVRQQTIRIANDSKYLV